MPGRRVSRTITVGESGSGRVDRFVASCADLPSRSQLRSRDARIEVNGVHVKLSHAVEPGDVVEISYLEVPEVSVEAEPLDLDILFENDDVVVLNKQQGMVVHPAAGNWSGTLVQGLLHHVSDLDAGDDWLRPGIVHRLDRDTSGVLIAAKTAGSLQFLSDQFRNREVEKRYSAIVKRAPPQSTGSVSANLGRDPRHRKRFTVTESGGKPATTEYRVVRRFNDYCLMDLHPLTGRTHQLRVHMLHLGCPILGDPVYSRKDGRFPDATLMLHASSLSIRLPGEKEGRVFSLPLPERFTRVLQDLEGRPS